MCVKLLTVDKQSFWNNILDKVSILRLVTVAGGVLRGRIRVAAWKMLAKSVLNMLRLQEC